MVQVVGDHSLWLTGEQCHRGHTVPHPELDDSFRLAGEFAELVAVLIDV